MGGTVEETTSGLRVVRYEEDKRDQKKVVREKDPVSLLLTKLAYWLQQQSEWHAIQDLPRPVRKNLERDVLKHVFRNLKDH